MLRCPPGSARFPYTTLFRSDVGQDRPLEVLRAGERAALEAAPAQQREPALDQVKPGRAGWCKMQVELWALEQPVVHEPRLVGLQVVEHEVHFQVLRCGTARSIRSRKA